MNMSIMCLQWTCGGESNTLQDFPARSLHRPVNRAPIGLSDHKLVVCIPSASSNYTAPVVASTPSRSHKLRYMSTLAISIRMVIQFINMQYFAVCVDVLRAFSNYGVFWLRYLIRPIIRNFNCD